MGAALAAVFASPQARGLRSVAIVPSENGDSEPLEPDFVVGAKGEEHPVKSVLDHLVAKKVGVPSSITRLALGDAFDRSRGYRCFDFFGTVAYSDDLTRVLAVFDHLEELRVDLGAVRITWAPLVSDRLKRFTLVSPFVRNSELTTLVESELPKLESFVLWTGQQGLVNTIDDIFDGPENLLSVDEMGGDTDEEVDDIEPLLGFFDRCESLREAGIVNYAGDLADLAPRIAKHAFAEKLHALDLSWCDFDADAAKAIAVLLAKAPQLRELRIAGSSADARAKLQRPGLTIVGETIEREAGETRTAYRYVITQE
jgi:hypothetical protein